MGTLAFTLSVVLYILPEQKQLSINQRVEKTECTVCGNKGYSESHDIPSKRKFIGEWMKPQCIRYLLICDKLCIIGKIAMWQTEMCVRAKELTPTEPVKTKKL